MVKSAQTMAATDAHMSIEALCSGARARVRNVKKHPKARPPEQAAMRVLFNNHNFLARPALLRRSRVHNSTEAIWPESGPYLHFAGFLALGRFGIRLWPRRCRRD